MSDLNRYMVGAAIVFAIVGSGLGIEGRIDHLAAVNARIARAQEQMAEACAERAP